MKFEMLEQICSQVNIGILVVDKNFKILETNQAQANLAGLKVDELLGKKCYEVCRGILCDTTSCPVKLIFAGQDSVNIETDIKCQNGIKKSCSISAKPFLNSEGEIIGVIQYFNDITERKKAEMALVESEKYYDLILNGINDMVTLYKVEKGPRFKYLKVNNSLIKMLGIPEDKLIGKYIEEVVSKDTAERWIANDIKAINLKKTIVEEVQVLNSIFETRYIPIFNENECTHLIVAARDIGEKKKLEEHMLQSVKLESVGLLAGGIAHDFNNILTAILGSISVAKLELEDNNVGETFTLLTEAEKASTKAKSLTQQLLTFAKGGMPILKPASVSELLKETASFALRGSNVLCKFNIAKDLWRANIDEDQISQVIHNLVINADQAMPEGGLIKITAENINIDYSDIIPLNPGKYVKIVIQDNGIGISEKHLDKVFDPYFTTKQKGSGLGLASSYSIIQGHKGYICVESTQGSGTTFSIYLPASNKNKFFKIKKKKKVSSGKGRVLIMDDENMIRVILSKMLKSLGYDATCTEDGKQTLEVFKKAQNSSSPYDIVIMDLTIPGGMGGKETIKKLLNIDAKANVIVASGYSNDPIMANYQEYGFKAVITKPFHIDELACALETIQLSE